ncbi:glycoside hydrolase family 99-like domain-containing protein [Sphingobium yanoikuyae]|uniref:glycoside hydrolase family 99-like domain-containing protein n=1 Tax=Sphingobium yanoikuyae TaxID=13690 RepID=UPI0035C76298
MLNECDENDLRIIRESGIFDEAWYIGRYPEVAKLGLDPIVHYIQLGAELNRDPSVRFSTKGYLDANPDVALANKNPLIHYITNGQYEARVVPAVSSSVAWVPGKSQYVSQESHIDLAAKRARLIAFYLPQFHPFPENDRWWGKGFTEWTNVRPAQAQFVGHYQPHVPHEDIGYYNLTDKAVQRKQIELAKIYGIEAFCFYYYWFAGHRLMESPIEAWLEDKSLDHPFCLCWANENWSRRWDGSDHEILIAQQHSAVDDINCISDIARYLRDPRYLRIDGRPLVLVYRPALLPFPKETAMRWRQWCRENGIGEIFLACTQSFGQTDLDAFGFDAVIEFPPNNSSPPDITDQAILLNDDFEGRIYDWKEFVRRSENYKDPGYKLFRSVCPGWDNTARRKNRGAIFADNTPELYEHWLNNAIDETVRTNPNLQERIVFVNAWNEWAEGAHLEPDQETGYAYLEATRRAIAGWPDETPPMRGRIALVCHDAYRHGAQYLSLNIARELSSIGYEVHVFLLGDGPLKDEFRKVAYLHDLSGHDPQGDVAKRIVNELYALGARSVISNTLVSSIMLSVFKDAGYNILTLVHEMHDVIRQYGLQNIAQSVARLSDHVVFASEPVAQSFRSFASLGDDQCVIKPQGLYKVNDIRRSRGGIEKARSLLREKLGIAASAPVILGVGYADKRKGVDLFVRAGLEVLRTVPDAIFVWLGHDAEDWTGQVQKIAADAGQSAHFHFPGLVEHTDIFYAGADIFALTSREDPFPSVALEAMDCGLPVVAFARATGMDDVITQCSGVLVPQFDTQLYGKAIVNLLNDDGHRHECSEKGFDLIDQKFSFSRYIHDIIHLVGENNPRVSVIIPSYNYEKYIVSRIQTVLNQKFKPYEIIIIDDNSSDNSVEVIKDYVSGCHIPVKVVVNERNSGSVFRQWQRGVEMAEGNVIWIAEADDLAHPSFLADTVTAFSDPDVVISYSQSRQIDSEGMVTAPDYLDYVADLDVDRWTKPYKVSGKVEIASGLYLKNTIPNASGVLFRKSVLQAVLVEHGEEILSYRNAGDWVAYLRVLERGSIAFNPKAMNDHRRHSASVTISNGNRRHYDEIVAVQADTIRRHDLGREAMDRAEAYAEHVAAHFGLEID